jgi:uncharacterized membrane protein
VILFLLSLYLMVKNRLHGLSAVCVAIAATVCYALARPVPGLVLQSRCSCLP